MKSIITTTFLFLGLFFFVSAASAQCPLSSPIVGETLPCDNSYKVYRIHYNNPGGTIACSWAVTNGNIKATRTLSFGRETVSYIAVLWNDAPTGGSLPGAVTVSFPSCNKSIAVTVQDPSGGSCN